MREAGTRIEVAATPVAVVRPQRRASMAVMPFGDRDAFAAGLTEDIIMQLAKLRVLFVIARGSTFALGARGLSARETGQLLEVDYVVGGSVRRDREGVVVELVDVRDGSIVWTDSLDAGGGETFAALDSIVQRIVVAIAAAGLRHSRAGRNVTTSGV